MEQEEFMVDPRQLRVEAENEPRRRGLTDYSETIRLLKQEKGFSFREIAAWLQQRGVKTDHNAVWRTYSRTVLGSQGSEVSERIERYKRMRTSEGAMPWLGQ